MTRVLNDNRIKFMYETILDSSKFNPDTWSEWLTNGEAVKFVATLTAAVALTMAACALWVATFGGATPLIVMAAAGAAGAIIGSEISSELVHLSQHTFNKDVRSGAVNYKERSRLGKVLEGQTVIDPVTGREYSMNFSEHVALPLAQQFLQNTLITFATMGLSLIHI